VQRADFILLPKCKLLVYSEQKVKKP